MSRARRAGERVCRNCAHNCGTDSSVSDAAGAARFRNPWSDPWVQRTSIEGRGQVHWVFVMLNSQAHVMSSERTSPCPLRSLQWQHSCDDSRARIDIEQEVPVSRARPEHQPHAVRASVERRFEPRELADDIAAVDADRALEREADGAVRLDHFQRRREAAA